MDKHNCDNVNCNHNDTKGLCCLFNPDNCKYRQLQKENAELKDDNKVNEWHYVKDVNCYEDLHFPPEEEEKGRVLIWKVQVITENGVRLPVCYHCGSYGDLWYEINAYHVIAWKEIVLPELKESE